MEEPEYDLSPVETPYGLMPVIVVRCCRTYLVVPLYGWHRCGLCGQRPEPV